MSKDLIQNKYDFVLLFDCTYGNPNGDPDSDNQPRIDPNTSHGIVTDACLKRKVRNYIAMRKGEEPGFKLYIQGNTTLNMKEAEAYISLGTDEKGIAEYRKNDPEADVQLRDFMCLNYYDIRTFGGVMTSFAKAKVKNAGIHGPVQFSMASSVSPVEIMPLTITRNAVATDAEFEKGSTTFGTKSVIPYGLFRMEGSVSPVRAAITHFTEEDLSLLWEALINMFEEDMSAARGRMRVRELIVFKHESKYGNAPSWKLCERISVKEKNPDAPAREYSDYIVEVDEQNLPETVTCKRMI